MKDYAFIFDMDGVIVDSNPFHKIALQQFCKKHGHPLTEEQLRTRIYGRTNKEWIAQLFGQLTPEQVTAYANEKEALFRDLFKNDIRPVKGLLPFLEALDFWKIPRAIGTSAPRANVDFTLSKTGTTRFFSVILDESNVNHGKPNPEIYLKVAQALNLPPQQCVVIEDSLSGVAAGKEAGSKVIGITTTHTKAELASTDLVIDHFEGLEPKNVLQTLFGGI
jgi:HAD superfamily hydrolase (TIGR01509 family)